MGTTGRTGTVEQSTAKIASEAEQLQLLQRLLSTTVRSEVRAALLDHEILMRDLEGSRRVIRSELKQQAEWFRMQSADAMRDLMKVLGL